MRRTLIAAILAAPLLLLAFFWLRPDLDPAWAIPLIHFYVVTFTSFAATVVSFLLVIAIGPLARPRHVLSAVSFAVMGSLFMVHGLTTPGALIPTDHPAVPAVTWSAWLTLFSGGIIFALAGFDRPQGVSRPLLWRVVLGVALGIMLYLSVVITRPQWLGAIEQNAAPWHRRLLFLSTLGVWLLAAIQLWRTWRSTRHRIDGALALVAVGMVEASMSLHLFPVWNLSWWLYHFMLLAGFLFTAYVLFAGYEQIRQFSLIRYYVAASLIMTALLALTASYLFTSYAQRLLSEEITGTAAHTLETFVTDVAVRHPDGRSAAQVRQTYEEYLEALPVDEVRLYDATGQPEGYGAGLHEGGEWQRALGGDAVVHLVEPGGTLSGYGEGVSAYTVYGYIGIGPAESPAGILATTTELPHLSGVILRVRAVGLLIAAGTMGLLFAVLLIVVSRADGILTARTKELAIAYRDLRRAEEMRDDLTHMIVHDLRTPLTAISASLGLLKRLPDEKRVEMQERIVARTSRAAGRLDRMIDDILMVAKMETGELNPSTRRVELTELLSEQLDSFQDQAVAEEKVLTIDCPSEIPVQLDPALTGRVLDNLVSNAFKYTEAGGHITVSARAKNGDVMLSVRDDGQGIPDDFKEYIFQKFSQVPESAEGSGRKGTGLGLTFCRLVVEAHGGRIWVDDAPEGGSEFKMQLPARPARRAGDGE